MSPLTWTVSDGGVHHADFGGGRYSVARTHGRVPRFVARWHRSRGPFTEGKNITGAPTIEAAKAACERHAEQRTDVPQGANAHRGAFGEVDVLVNNAGLMIVKPIVESDRV